VGVVAVWRDLGMTRARRCSAVTFGVHGEYFVRGSGVCGILRVLADAASAVAVIAWLRMCLVCVVLIGVQVGCLMLFNGVGG
jgi:hypothetical protein